MVEGTAELANRLERAVDALDCVQVGVLERYVPLMGLTTAGRRPRDQTARSP